MNTNDYCNEHFIKCMIEHEQQTAVHTL